ncbi:DNA repair protein RecO [Namhaeicola litoreus]|uniref:DNA repair protein RecO n=1 Tax=Namhaeicola litoreus TaxID=1052145 RepID=A0ABW3Y277_9FLAO
MISKTKAIVISSVKYGDSDLIVKCFTPNGLRSYLLRRIYSSKNKQISIAYFQALNLLEISGSDKKNGQLNTIKEVNIDVVYHSIHGNIYKQSTAIFMAEVLSSVIWEESDSQSLFDFLHTAFQWFDEHQNTANFHLVFLLKLTQYLGFYPEVKNSDLKYFNLQDGIFTNVYEKESCIEGNILNVFKALIGINFDSLEELKLSSGSRQIILEVLMKYFQIHLTGFRKPKSLEIFKELFH